MSKEKEKKASIPDKVQQYIRVYYYHLLYLNILVNVKLPKTYSVIFSTITQDKNITRVISFYISPCLLWVPYASVF